MSGVLYWCPGCGARFGAIAAGAIVVVCGVCAGSYRVVGGAMVAVAQLDDRRAGRTLGRLRRRIGAGT